MHFGCIIKNSRHDKWLLHALDWWTETESSLHVNLEHVQTIDWAKTSYHTLRHYGRGLLTRQVKHQVVHRSIDIITKARNTKESVCMFRSKYVMYFFRNLLNNFFAHKALKFTTNNNEKSCASPRWTYIKNKNSAKYTNL